MTGPSAPPPDEPTQLELPLGEDDPTDDEATEPEDPAVPQDPGGGVAPRPVGRSATGPHPPHVMHAVALMVANGARYEDIEAATGVRVSTLKSWVNERTNETFSQILDGYRETVLKRTTEHQWRLLRLLDHSYGAIERAMVQTNDPRLAKDTAWELMDRVIPRRSTPEVPVSVTLQSVHLQQELHTTFNRVGDKFVNLLERLSEQPVNQYIREGADTYEIPSGEIPTEVGSIAFTGDPADGTRTGNGSGDPSRPAETP